MHYDFHFLNGETNTEILLNLSMTMFPSQGASQFGGIVILLLGCLEVKLTVIWNRERLPGTHTVRMDR